MRKNYDEVLETKYTREEVDKIVSVHAEKIIQYCRDLELQFIERGLYNTYETMRVLFDLRDNGIYEQVCGQGISQTLYDGIKDGFIVEVYRFEAGMLEETALEGLDYGGDGSDAYKLYSMYKDDEITEEEYYEKYDEVIQPWINNYIEDYLDNTVDIYIDYLDTEENDDDYWD